MDTEDKVRRLIRPAVLQSAAYHVPDAAGLVKLDAMENPHSWPDNLRDEWLHVLRDTRFNRYPDADAVELKRRLRRVFSIPDGALILLGNGSDEIIQIIALALARPGAVLLAPEPSFAMYRAVAMAANLEYAGVPLREPEFSLDGEAMEAALDRLRPAVVFIASPNNPTGNLFAADLIERIVQRAPGLVVIDEAYHAYADCSFLPLVARYDNLLIMRTLSKLGLAGLRLGFLAGRACWLEEFEKLRLPYNVSVLTQKSIGFFLDHMDVLGEQTRQIRRDRDRLIGELSRLPGTTVWPSAANFVLFKVDGIAAPVLHEELRRRDILIKCLDGAHPLLRGCLRVTVGSADENHAFLAALTALTGSAS